MATPATSTTTQPRKPAAKRAPRTTARAARRATRTAARRTTSSSTRPASRAARAQEIAERAVLIPVGAALEARDRVAGTVGDLVTTTRSRSALEQQLRHFERRGGSARTQLEREVRRTRTRLERETRNARRGFDRQRSEARRNLDGTRKNLGGNVESLTTRVENVVQNGVNAGMKLFNGAQDRIAKVA